MPPQSVLTRKGAVFIGLVLLAYLLFTLTAVRPVDQEFNLSAELYEAIQIGSVSEVQKLLHRGANPNREGAGGLVGGTPLIWATQKADLSLMKVLLKGGANVNQAAQIATGGYTALMLAPSPQVAQVLLDAGADPQLINAEGKTALQCAQEAKLPQVVKVLQRVEPKEHESTSRQ